MKSLKSMIREMSRDNEIEKISEDSISEAVKLVPFGTHLSGGEGSVIIKIEVLDKTPSESLEGMKVDKAIKDSIKNLLKVPSPPGARGKSQRDWLKSRTVNEKNGNTYKVQSPSGHVIARVKAGSLIGSNTYLLQLLNDEKIKIEVTYLDKDGKKEKVVTHEPHEYDLNGYNPNK